MLAAAWQSGDQAGVKAAFLPLSDAEGFSALASTGTERQVHHQSAIGQLSSLLHLHKAHICSQDFTVLHACDEVIAMKPHPAAEGYGRIDCRLSQSCRQRC